MDGLSIAANVAGIVSLGLQTAQFLLNYYRGCKGREKDLASTTKKLDRLLGLLESLNSHMDKTKSASDSSDTELAGKLRSTINDCEKCIKELENQRNKFTDVTSAGIRAKARSAAQKLAYPLQRSTLAAIDKTVDEIVSHISLALQIIQQKATEEIKELLHLVQADQIDRSTRDWLAAPDISSNYYAASGARHSNTGDWLVNGEAFSSWLADANSFLWLYGFAGCGKSVLCSTAIRHVFRRRESNAQIAIAFFFFTFNDNSKQDASAMLRAIVLQLAGQVKGGREALSKLYEKHKHGKPPNEVLRACLLDLIKSSHETYILIDALDESPRDIHRQSLLDTLIDMRQWSEHRLHLLVTSRDEPDIRDAIATDMGAVPNQMISLKNSSIDSDIAAFIAGKLESDGRLRKWSKYHDHIQKSLTERANGVFRWVECQVVALASTPKSKRQLNAVLAALPRTLDETYQRMLENIGEESKDDARRLLTLLCCATRPLTVAEVIEGIAVQLGDNPRLDIDGRLEGEDDILQLCPGLVEIDHRAPYHYDYMPWNYIGSSDAVNANSDGDGRPNAFDSTLRIAHFSVQEYLESDRISKGSVPSFRVDLPDAHAEIASVCLTYVLGLPTTPSRYEYALTQYATLSWIDHYRRANVSQHGAQDQALRLFGPGAEKRKIWKVYGWRYEVNPPDAFSPIFYAAGLGLHSLLAVILSRGPYCTLSYEELGQLFCETNALNTAVYYGWLDVVKLLVEKGALSPPGSGGNALMCAVRYGHDDIARYLVSQGVDVNYCSPDSCLFEAVKRRNVTIAEILIERGAKAMRMTSTGCEVVSAGELLFTALDGRAMVELLVEKYPRFNTADVDKAAVPKCNKEGKWIGLNDDGYILRLLGKAARSGGLDYVSLLLDHVAETELSIETTRSLILAMARHGGFEMVQLLIAKGMQLSVSLAVMVFSEHLQQRDSQKEARLLGCYLIANCVGVGLSSVAIEHVFEILASYGLTEMAEELIQQNSRLDDDVRMSCYSGALQHAARHGRCEVVKQLLAMGADVNFEGGFYSTALYAAVLGGHEAEVRLLIGNGASVNTLRDGSGTGWNDMDDAEEERSLRLSNKDLLQNAFKDNTGTALHVAVTLGLYTIVELLIEEGANVELRRTATGFASMAMGAAARRIARGRPTGNGIGMQHSARSMDLIVYCEAMTVTYRGDNMRAHTLRFCTPLEAAAFGQSERTARLLIASGAQITNSGGFSTPLHCAVQSRAKGILGVLTEKGADVNLHCDTFGTPLQAVYREWFEILDPLSFLDIFRWREQRSIVEILMKNGADINFRCRCHTSVLQEAASRGDTEVVQLLIDNGADVNLQGRPKGTAVLAASLNKDYGTVKLLLENGADPTLSDGIYDMPIMNRLRLETSRLETSSFERDERPLLLYHLLERHGCREMMWVAPKDFTWPYQSYESRCIPEVGSIKI